MISANGQKRLDKFCKEMGYEDGLKGKTILTLKSPHDALNFILSNQSYKDNSLETRTHPKYKLGPMKLRNINAAIINNRVSSSEYAKLDEKLYLEQGLVTEWRRFNIRNGIPNHEWHYMRCSIIDKYTERVIATNAVTSLLPLNKKDNIELVHISDELVMLIEKPVKIHKSADGKLHNTEGPAVEYSDGQGYCFVNGSPMKPKYILNKDKITSRAILNEQNLEVRRSMLDLLGAENLTNLFKSKPIDVQTLNGREVTLCKSNRPITIKGTGWSVPLREYLYTINVRCASTDKKYTICVPEHKDALAALAWTFNKTKEEYVKGLKIET